jgi:hypothetical protein
MSPHQAPGSPPQPTDQAPEADLTRPRPFFADPPADSPAGVADAVPGESESAEPAQPPASSLPYGEPAPRGPQYGQPPPGFGSPPGQPQDGDPSGRRPANQPPPGPPAYQRQRTPPSRELRQRAIAALVFGGVSLIALFGLSADLRKGIYLLGFSALVGVAACVIGISALVKARRTGSYRPRGAIAGIVLGVIGILISTPIIITYLAFPTQLTNYVNCLTQAQDPSQQQACMNSFYKSIGLDTSALNSPKPVKP